MAGGAPGVNLRHSGGAAAPLLLHRAAQGAEQLSTRACAALGWQRVSLLDGLWTSVAQQPAHHSLASPPSCPDAADKGATALMAAAVHGRADIVSSLLSNGADPALTLPGTREAPGKTARQLAELYGHAAVLEVLDDHQEQVGGSGWLVGWEEGREGDRASERAQWSADQGWLLGGRVGEAGVMSAVRLVGCAPMLMLLGGRMATLFRAVHTVRWQRLECPGSVAYAACCPPSRLPPPLFHPAAATCSFNRRPWRRKRRLMGPLH